MTRRERWIAVGWTLYAIAVLVAVLFFLTACAVMLPVALGIQGAIGAGSNIIGGVKWWEDRAFQREALDNQKAMTGEIRSLRTAVEAHQEEVRRLRLHDVSEGLPQP